MPQLFKKKLDKALATIMEAAQDRHFNQVYLLRAYADLVLKSKSTYELQTGKSDSPKDTEAK